METQGFGKDSGPGKDSGSGKPSFQFGKSPTSSTPPISPNPFTNVSPSQPSPRLVTGSGVFSNYNASEPLQSTPSPPGFGRNPSPHKVYHPAEETPRLVTGPGVFFNNSGYEPLQRRPSPPSDFGRIPSTHKISHLTEDSSRPTVSPSRWGTPSQSFVSDSVPSYATSLTAGTSTSTKPANFQGLKWIRSPPSASNVYLKRSPEDVDGRSQTKPSNFQAPKRSRSPPLLPTSEVHWRNSDAERAFASPRLGDNSNSVANNANSTTQQRLSSFSPRIDAEGDEAKITNFQSAKRTRSPPFSSADDLLPGTLYSSCDDTEREMQAKAKRLARFSNELSQPVQSSLDYSRNKSQGNKQALERQKIVAKLPSDAAGDLILPDNEGVEASSVITGLCPDMCPESERAERERKGDLDKYERLDGDRNQTSRFLAVKKYTRTAEREADLIRPMPVLQKTIDYLLALLDQPYDDRFLVMYNFLWDRMRAIRMDLRMQHIFDQDAITMLEQMIRLHIIAMHELCEYTKGEGFSEGFDAHLNIEQMNKTSVELFQLYDDHRKKGHAVPSEKEFRGYYALLKLDKHPGYKVEPAELSLDLAKMTPEIRRTPQILFARDVARACRTGNFIAFFRLAKKATYLQACLMHAHFAKLRTQALASLYSGLQNNQGIPIAHVTKWLGMEDEDIESLLEYHGFLIKEFGEPYMVKEGPFLNSDKDYQIKCSQLVHLKKSKRIMEDVSFDLLISPVEQTKEVVTDKVDKPDSKAIPPVQSKPLVHVIDEEMLESREDLSTVYSSPVKPMLRIPSITDKRVGSVGQAYGVQDIPSLERSPLFAPAKVGILAEPARVTIRNNSLERNLRPDVKETPFQFGIGRAPETKGSPSLTNEAQMVSPTPERVVPEPQRTDEVLVDKQEVEDDILLHEEVENEEDFMVQQELEIATAKLKLIIRKWRQLSSKRRELREERQLVANAALGSLSLGLPIQRLKSQPSPVRELDIDQTVRDRYEKRMRSWSRLNTSEVVADILGERYLGAKCICWKLLVCSGVNGTGGESVQRSQTDHLASLWLHSKLMGVKDENDDELAVSYTGLSIWKKWVTSQYNSFAACCLSIIREVNFGELEDTVAGVDAVLFLVSESISWELQKELLNSLLMSLPSGSYVPLLILSSSCKEEHVNLSLIASRLDLHLIDRTRVSSFSVVSLVEDQPPDHLHGFFSSNCLTEGLQWLASQSPVQAGLHCTRTRELVMNRLNFSLDVLEKMDISVVDPSHCISAFNNALDKSAEEVATAANTNPASRPCPEIDLLEDLSDERRAVEAFLPVVGWSSDAKIEPIISRFRDCKLPLFPDGLSWLNNDSYTSEEILNQKSELEKCLIRYLTRSSKMMDVMLATTEARVMLQKGAVLDLQGSAYYIKPRWLTIFRRIFNWRLANLTSGLPSVAYVLKQPSRVEPDTIVTQVDASPADRFGQPSLDEMIEVCFNSSLSGREQSEPLVVQPLAWRIDSDDQVDVAETTDNIRCHENFQQEVVSTQTPDDLSRSYFSEGIAVANQSKKEADKLSQLLEQCTMLQDSIDKKLAIYF